MVRSRRTKIAAEEKTRLVLAVLAGEMTGAEAARRCGVSVNLVTKWKHQFLEAGAQRLQEVPSGSPGNKGSAEATSNAVGERAAQAGVGGGDGRIWQRGAALADQVPSRTSKP